MVAAQRGRSRASVAFYSQQRTFESLQERKSEENQSESRRVILTVLVSRVCLDG